MNRKARDQISKSLPDMVDLIRVGIEAGWSFDQCVDYLVKRFNNPATRQFKAAYAEIARGTPKAAALHAMATRCRVEDLTTFVQTVLMSEQTGGGLVELVRLQSEEIRRRHRVRSEERVHKAPIKMTMASAVFIFPAILLALGAPAAVTIFHDVLHIG
jgi:tight adherence protein C